MASRKQWSPDRRDMIWINCNPQAGREMKDIHPLLVLSPKTFNERTGIVIGLPMTTAPFNDTNPFAVKFMGPKGVAVTFSDINPNHSIGEFEKQSHIPGSGFLKTSSFLLVKHSIRSSPSQDSRHSGPALQSSRSRRHQNLVGDGADSRTLNNH